MRGPKTLAKYSENEGPKTLAKYSEIELRGPKTLA